MRGAMQKMSGAKDMGHSYRRKTLAGVSGSACRGLVPIIKPTEHKENEPAGRARVFSSLLVETRPNTD